MVEDLKLCTSVSVTPPNASSFNSTHAVILMAVPSPIASVLHVVDLVHCLTAFQPGFAQSDLMLVKAVRTHADGTRTRPYTSLACWNATIPRYLRVWLEHASLAAVTRLLKRDATLAETLLEDAACLGRVDLVAFLHATWPVRCTKSALDNAAAAGHLAVVAFLHAHRSEGGTTDAMDVAAAHGHVHVLEFLHAHRAEGCTHRALNLAAHAGHLSTVRFLCRHYLDSSRPTIALEIAAGSGHLHVVQCLHQVTPRCSTAAVDGAVAAGHLTLVEFLLTHRVEGGSVDAVQSAAASGHADILALLLAHGPTLTTWQARGDPDTMVAAATRGHLACVILLAPHTHDWAPAIRGATSRGHVMVVAHLLQHERTIDDDDACIDTIANAVRRSQLSQCLMHGVDVDAKQSQSQHKRSGRVGFGRRDATRSSSSSICRVQ
ncbi:Aste57867_12396 [Aphanomyces stellatus]|uniref:Aste57867_12396 protein n=1 Tax=Aphanomyces stellatus TaxID=120398 RepID=A0A485KXF6_9STRA|nr:hypothetical protein As57867_012350 [Aphanomyces stellatus]VFT89247.1 Aste57867_12396 [Aphanomyces stellatus]